MSGETARIPDPTFDGGGASPLKAGLTLRVLSRRLAEGIADAIQQFEEQTGLHCEVRVQTHRPVTAGGERIALRPDVYVSLETT